MDAVGNIIAQRQRDRVPWVAAAVLAFLLHAGVLIGMLASALARPVRLARPRAVAVRLLSAGSLARPAPVRPLEAPPSAPKPKIEKPVEEPPPPPSKQALLLPAKESKKKPTPPPVSRPGPAATPAISLPSVSDEATAAVGAGPSGAEGAAGLGSLRLDQADFKYPDYIERFVRIISINWARQLKPAQSFQVVVHFQIERDGTVTDLRLVTSCGLPFVDRAALRTVLDSSPLPPLPAEYGGPHLGIQVVFE